jgi:hypothetical protein
MICQWTANKLFWLFELFHNWRAIFGRAPSEDNNKTHFGLAQ